MWLFQGCRAKLMQIQQQQHEQLTSLQLVHTFSQILRRSSAEPGCQRHPSSGLWHSTAADRGGLPSRMCGAPSSSSTRRRTRAFWSRKRAAPASRPCWSCSLLTCPSADTGRQSSGASVTKQQWWGYYRRNAYAGSAHQKHCMARARLLGARLLTVLYEMQLRHAAVTGVNRRLRPADADL